MSYHDLRSTADIEQRLSYHPASSPERQAQHEAVRAACKRLAHALDRIVPPGRHKALALTSVEESMHWANAAVACQVEPEPSRNDDRPPHMSAMPVVCVSGVCYRMPRQVGGGGLLSVVRSPG